MQLDVNSVSPVLVRQRLPGKDHSVAGCRKLKRQIGAATPFIIELCGYPSKGVFLESFFDLIRGLSVWIDSKLFADVAKASQLYEPLNLSSVPHLVNSAVDDDRIELIGQRAWRVLYFPGRDRLPPRILLRMLYLDRSLFRYLVDRVAG